MLKLLNILKYRRPAGSASERECVDKYIKSHPHVMVQGNVVITTPKSDGSASTTLFSCHTDTVHFTAGVQVLVNDTDFGRVFSAGGGKEKPAQEPEALTTSVGFRQKWNANEYVLGADDGAGIWLLLNMIEAKVPGTYVFHHSEERGGVGSRAMADNEPDFLKQFQRAIAFDRKGSGDIITSQRGGRCCSDAFADELAGRLNALGHGFAKNSGSFTDTANYIQHIPECTNLSCGYHNEHTDDEWLDTEFLFRMRDAVLKIEWDTLPAVRDHTYVPPPVYYGGYSRFNKQDYDSWSDSGYLSAQEEWDMRIAEGHSTPDTPTEEVPLGDYTEDLEALFEMELEELEATCWDSPEYIAEILYFLLHSEVVKEAVEKES